MVTATPIHGASQRGLSSRGPLSIGPHFIERPILLAPMAGVSESPYRIIALRMGAGLAATELVSAKGLELGNARTAAYLRNDPAREPILAVQIFGGEPESMARAAELAVGHGAKIIDVNMGCPVKKVTKNGAGCALMTDPARASAIVAAMCKRVGSGVPITVKIRAGWDPDHQNATEVGKALEDAGAAAIAIHPRTRVQGYSGTADWTRIRALVEAVAVPVIANGDIFTVDDADRVVNETGCAAVMIGRAALGNPWIFRELAASWARRPLPAAPTAAERAALILEHFDAHLEHAEDEVRGVRQFRQHLIWYSRGMRGGGTFRERAVRLDGIEAVREAVESFFTRCDVADVGEAPIYDERVAFG